MQGDFHHFLFKTPVKFDLPQRDQIHKYNQILISFILMWMSSAQIMDYDVDLSYHENPPPIASHHLFQCIKYALSASSTNRPHASNISHVKNRQNHGYL